jgi:hypothetical protein
MADLQSHINVTFQDALKVKMGSGVILAGMTFLSREIETRSDHAELP